MSNIQAIVTEACSSRFKGCGFSICASEGSSEDIEPEPLNETANRILKSRKSTEQINNLDYVQMEWLKSDLDCITFMKEFNSRYGNLKSLTGISQMRRAELKIVLKESCSERFARCNFAGCDHKNGGLSSTDFLRLAKEVQERRVKKIIAAMTREKAANATWQAFTIK